MGQRPGGERVVPAPLFPDAGVEHPVGRGLEVARERDDGSSGHLLPVQQQRVVRYRDHVADLGAVIASDDPVLLDQSGAGVALLFRVWIDRVGEVPPADQVVADGVPPVLARILGRVGLVEEVPAALPEAESVGVIEQVLRVDIVIAGTMRIPLQLLPRRDHASQQRILLKLQLLLFQGLGEGVVGNARGVIGLPFPHHGSLSGTALLRRTDYRSAQSLGLELSRRLSIRTPQRRQQPYRHPVNYCRDDGRVGTTNRWLISGTSARQPDSYSPRPSDSSDKVILMAQHLLTASEFPKCLRD